jgi:photosystem II stability/assembly factor-like uncharacterized protein
MRIDMKCNKAAAGLVFLALGLAPMSARASWTVVTEDPVRDNGYTFVSAIDHDSLAVLGVAGGAYVLRRSDDDGGTWRDMTYTGELLLPMFMTVHFRDETNGWMGGLGAIYYTTDGTSFTEVQIPGEWWGPIPLSTVRMLRSYSLQDALAVGESSSISGTSSVLILVTGDGGLTWTEVDNAIAVTINGLEAVDDEHTWMVGAKGYDLDGDDWPDRYDQGTIFFSDDRGLTWTENMAGLPYGPMAVDFLDAGSGWIIGTDGATPVILVTEDGGDGWRSPHPADLGIPADTDELLYVKVLSRCEIWLIGHRSVGDSIGDLFLHSLDGGNHFVEEYDYEGQSVMFTYDFADRTRGWAAGAYLTLLRYEAETSDPGGDCTFPAGDPVEPGEVEEVEEIAEQPVEGTAETVEIAEPAAEEPHPGEEVEQEDAGDGAGEDIGGEVEESGCSCALAS